MVQVHDEAQASMAVKNGEADMTIGNRSRYLLEFQRRVCLA